MVSIVTSNESERLRARDRMSSLVNSKLDEDILHVRFDGLRCNAERAGDLFVRLALGNQFENGALAWAQRFPYAAHLLLRIEVVVTTVTTVFTLADIRDAIGVSLLAVR
jgi:hypothetical protein